MIIDNEVQIMPLSIEVESLTYRFQLELSLDHNHLRPHCHYKVPICLYLLAYCSGILLRSNFHWDKSIFLWRICSQPILRHISFQLHWKHRYLVHVFSLWTNFLSKYPYWDRQTFPILLYIHISTLRNINSCQNRSIDQFHPSCYLWSHLYSCHHSSMYIFLFLVLPLFI